LFALIFTILKNQGKIKFISVATAGSSTKGSRREQTIFGQFKSLTYPYSKADTTSLTDGLRD